VYQRLRRHLFRRRFLPPFFSLLFKDPIPLEIRALLLAVPRITELFVSLQIPAEGIKSPEIQKKYLSIFLLKNIFAQNIMMPLDQIAFFLDELILRLWVYCIVLIQTI
jgi:hypothetical protein